MIYDGRDRTSCYGGGRRRRWRLLWDLSTFVRAMTVSHSFYCVANSLRDCVHFFFLLLLLRTEFFFFFLQFLVTPVAIYFVVSAVPQLAWLRDAAIIFQCFSVGLSFAKTNDMFTGGDSARHKNELLRARYHIVIARTRRDFHLKFLRQNIYYYLFIFIFEINVDIFPPFPAGAYWHYMLYC